MIAVSRPIARVVEVGGVSPERLRLVHEGVEDRPPQAGGRSALEQIGVPRGALVIGNVAALTEHKDHSTLLSAMAQVLREAPEARLVIVGDGELRGALEGQARTLGIESHCVFAGFRDDLDRLLPAFDVFCLSSLMEGLGTSLLDAMVFARPIVATAAGGIPDAVTDGLNGLLVSPRDAGALGQALLALLHDETRRRTLGAAGRRVYEQRFTAERMVGETLRVYDEA